MAGLDHQCLVFIHLFHLFRGRLFSFKALADLSPPHPHTPTNPQIDTQEYPTDMISIAVAQRYSILVTARNDTSSNWAIHANMDTDMFDTVPDTLNPSASPFFLLPPSFCPPSQLPCVYGLQLANNQFFLRLPVWCGTDVTSSITYDSSVSTTDDGFVDEYTMLNDTALVPSEAVAMYPPADVTIPLLALFDTMDDGELLPSPSFILTPSFFHFAPTSMY